MKGARSAGFGLVAAIAVGSTLAGTTSAAGPEYQVKGLPEFGRCVVAVPKHSGNYAGMNKCLKVKTGGKSRWIPLVAGQEHLKFAFNLVSPTFKSTGAHAVTIECGSSSGAGEYTGEKTFTLQKFNLVNCSNPAISGAATFCQTNEAPGGEITVPELTGEMGFVTKSKKVIIPGFVLRGSFAFECEGYNEILKKGLGTGTAREIKGSVIGRVTSPLGEMVSTKFAARYEVAHGAQSPERFQGGEKETLTTAVGTEKTEEPTLLTGALELLNQQSQEIKVRCKGC
jgi:hypothetical protein